MDTSPAGTDKPVTPGSILQGYGAWINGEYVKGNIKNTSIDKTTLNPGESTIIKAGFLSENITVSANNVTAAVSNIKNLGGTCPDNPTPQELADAIGTIPIKPQVSNMNGTVEYQKHYHDSNSECYQAAVTRTCGGRIGYGYSNGVMCTCGIYTADYIYCESCHYRYGIRCDVYNTYSGESYPSNGICNKRIVTSPAKYTCGYSDGQIIGATITF